MLLMRSGDLDKKIKIQEFSTSQDSLGYPVETWTDVATVAAKVTHIRGIEQRGTDQTRNDIYTRFKIRWRDGVTPKNRVVYDGVNYDIVDVGEIGRREALEIDGRARADDA